VPYPGFHKLFVSKFPTFITTVSLLHWIRSTEESTETIHDEEQQEYEDILPSEEETNSAIRRRELIYQCLVLLNYYTYTMACEMAVKINSRKFLLPMSMCECVCVCARARARACSIAEYVLLGPMLCMLAAYTDTHTGLSLTVNSTVKRQF
jgi:hypothetical protein